MMTIEEMVAKAGADGASDIHVICNLPPKYRINGDLEDMSSEICTEEYCISIARELAGSEARFEELMRHGELDAAGTYAGSRCRIHLFKQQGVPSLALRILAERIPDLMSLGLPLAVMDLPKLHKGIVLVTGETGSGKSTTLHQPQLQAAHRHLRRSGRIYLQARPVRDQPAGSGQGYGELCDGTARDAA